MTNWISDIIIIAVICFLYELWREFRKNWRRRDGRRPGSGNHNSNGNGEGGR